MKDDTNTWKLFNQINNIGDGIVNEKNIKGLKTKIKSDTLEKDAEEIYKNIDIDNKRYSEYEEFVIVVANKERFLNENVLNLAFRLIDKDGFLMRNNFWWNWKIFKDSISDKNNVWWYEKIIAKVDTYRNGIISFNMLSDFI